MPDHIPPFLKDPLPLIPCVGGPLCGLDRPMDISGWLVEDTHAVRHVYALMSEDSGRVGQYTGCERRMAGV